MKFMKNLVFSMVETLKNNLGGGRVRALFIARPECIMQMDLYMRTVVIAKKSIEHRLFRPWCNQHLGGGRVSFTIFDR